jgi:DNA-binding CsgD family transcriptional regulator
VSEAQNISPHTARAQLKSIFSKTGVSRQAELVRLILKSVASLA